SPRLLPPFPTRRSSDLVCLEPLSPPDADFMNTAAQAVAILDALAHPAFALHLDVKAMSTDEAPAPELIRRHASRMHHFHANDPRSEEHTSELQSLAYLV